MHLKLSLLLILSLSFPFAYSKYMYISPHDNKNNPCTTDSFDCGNVGYLAYPFWGGNRKQDCGRSSSFELYCVQNIPMLNISSTGYRVQEIDFNSSSLRVARDDLLISNTCPGHPVHDTSIDPDLFKYPPNKDYANITLYFGCKLPHDMVGLVNKFRCSVDGVETINLFGSKPENVSCKENIFVPINKEAAQSLGDLNDSSINALRTALNIGFRIQWLNDGLERTRTFCNRNVYASCISNNSNIYNRPCNYQNRCQGGGGGSDTSSQGPTPAQSPEGSPADENPPPVQSPAGYSVITKNGSRALPIQSPAHPPQSASSGGGSSDPSSLVQSPEGSPAAGMRTRAPSQSPAYLPQSRGTGGRSHNKTRKTLGVVLGVTGIVFLMTIGAVWFLKRRGFPSSTDQESNYQAVEAFLLQHGSLALKRYKYSEIKKMTKSLSDKLGQGGYGSVYRGKLPDGTLVAVKVLSSIDGNVEDFVNEVASISRTSHVNIVNLLGFCFDRKKRALVYEYMPNKSLDKYICNSGTNFCLDMEILYMIAVGVAEGLEYLHRGCNTRIVHFDIKPQNILLDEEFCPKISDFGLAKMCKKKQSLLSVPGTRGTVGYIAPEVFSRNFGGVSHKSDVYSYGMMVLEMAGANMVVGHTNETTQSMENYFPDKIYERVLDKTRKLDGFEIEVKEETARKMLLIGFWCIQTNPSDRPSISKVLEMLEGSLESIQIPPKPVLFTPTLPVWGVSSSFSSYVEEAQPSAEGVTQTQFKVSVNGSG